MQILEGQDVLSPEVYFELAISTIIENLNTIHENDIFGIKMNEKIKIY